MHMREVKDKYPMDGIRLQWNDIIHKAEKLLDIDPSNIEYVNIILTIKKYYGMDDIEAYFKFLEKNKTILSKVGL